MVRGAVQGVGFRPFVFHLAHELALAGWTRNSGEGVEIEVEGAPKNLAEFRRRVESDAPRAAEVQSVEASELPATGRRGFEIRESPTDGAKRALILPDMATCPECLREIFDPANRRHLYPFTNCTHCGPRFSIIEALPYDRAHTAMKHFAMCDECAREYHDPHDRRFHAQPNACPRCGPHLEFWDAQGRNLWSRHEALLEAVRAAQDGKILALKGIGGFQLIVDARNEAAVARLRERKHRPEKPLALLFPTLAALEEVCRVSALEKKLLTSRQAPIVLVEKKSSPTSIAPAVAPGNVNYGVMLPCSPLHHLLARELGFPVVATSGNLSDEPICIDEREALERLGDVADVFLVHNRPIVRQLDDSVVRVMMEEETLMRGGRGYAPLSVPLSLPGTESILAVGAHLKNAVALKVGSQAIVSQHIGDLETEQAFAAFRTAVADLPRLYDTAPAVIACDLHPDYISTKYARQRLAPAICAPVQHHYAHVLACLAEHHLEGPALGVCWDGTGYGSDGRIWGGEFLLLDDSGFERMAHFREFRLPGGDAAVKQPRRSALGLLDEAFGASAFQLDTPPLRHFSESEQRMLQRMLATGVNSPFTSSAGRLFDAVASLVGLRQRVTFEGQAAMDLECAVTPGTAGSYAFELIGEGPAIIDWRPMLVEIMDDAPRRPVGEIAAKFHHTLAEIIVCLAQRAGEAHVLLTGGCFQNKYLTECAVRRLQEAGFRPFWHHRVPPNDGGIALGQIMGALRAAAKSPERKETYVPGHTR